MVIKYSCPKCGEKKAIRYGRFKFKKRQPALRVLCLDCKKTSTIRASFFNNMRYPEDIIHEAITSYSQLKPVRSIAYNLKIQPNTVTSWVKKLCEQPLLYKEYLKDTKGLSEPDAINFFAKIRHAIRTRTLRTNKNILETGLEQVFSHFQEQNLYQESHPVSTGRYKTKRNRPF